MNKPTLKLPAQVAARYERRNAKRRKVHLVNGDGRAACGSHSDRVTLDSFAAHITCETCRVLLAKGGV